MVGLSEDSIQSDTIGTSVYMIPDPLEGLLEHGKIL